jgi:hypothetical protein
MIVTFLLGSLLTIGNMVIQIFAVVMVVRILLKKLSAGELGRGLKTDVCVIIVVISVLFAGHVLQFAIWATLFVLIGQFTEFSVAFYFSTVNFTSLGYGDIVMDARWRLLGGFEAANGVLMFGLSTGTILSVMSYVFSRYITTHRENK